MEYEISFRKYHYSYVECRWANLSCYLHQDGILGLKIKSKINKLLIVTCNDAKTFFRTRIDKFRCE